MIVEEHRRYVAGPGTGMTTTTGSNPAWAAWADPLAAGRCPTCDQQLTITLVALNAGEELWWCDIDGAWAIAEASIVNLRAVPDTPVIMGRGQNRVDRVLSTGSG